MAIFWLSYWKQNHDVLEHNVKYVNESEHSKSDLQGHNRSPVMTPFDRPHTISYYSSIATMSLSCTISETLWCISQNLWSRDSEHILFRGNLSCSHLVLLCVNQYTAFAVPNFTDSKDTIGGCKNGSRNEPHPLGRVYHPKANTWYILQPVYKNWWLSLQLFWGYDHWSQASKLKMGHHVTLATPLLGALCQPKARTWYSLPACQI